LINQQKVHFGCAESKIKDLTPFAFPCFHAKLSQKVVFY
jgi:hypothetical protein